MHWKALKGMIGDGQRVISFAEEEYLEMYSFARVVLDLTVLCKWIIWAFISSRNRILGAEKLDRHKHWLKILNRVFL